MPHSSRFSQQRTAGLFNDRYSQFKRHAKQVSHSTTNNFSKSRSDQSGINKNAIIKNKINKIANKPPMVVGSMINKSIKHFLRFNNDKVTNKRSYQFKSGLEKKAHREQCDQIGRFSKVLGTAITYKSSPNIC